MSQHDQEPLEKREAAIKFEIDRIKAEKGEEAFSQSLTNFWMFLDKTEGNYGRELSHMVGNWDKTLEETGGANKDQFSELRRGMKDADFYAAIDKAVQDLQLTQEIDEGVQQIYKIKKYVNTTDIKDEALVRLAETSRERLTAYFIKFFEKIEPLYVRLRAEGFSHYDLAKTEPLTSEK